MAVLGGKLTQKIARELPGEKQTTDEVHLPPDWSKWELPSSHFLVNCPGTGISIMTFVQEVLLL